LTSPADRPGSKSYQAVAATREGRRLNTPCRVTHHTSRCGRNLKGLTP
jgi:hypothetical protein